MGRFKREDIEKKVCGIIADKLYVNLSECRPEAVLGADLGADSLDAIELTMELEKEFGIVIPDERMRGMAGITVGGVCDLVEEFCI